MTIEGVAALLHGHASHEEAQLEPMLRQTDQSSAERLMKDHRRLDDELEKLRAVVRALDSSQPTCVESLLQLHLNWNRFLSAYLSHLDDEERTLFPQLGDEATSLAIIAQSAAAQGPEQGRAFSGTAVDGNYAARARAHRPQCSADISLDGSEPPARWH